MPMDDATARRLVLAAVATGFVLRLAFGVLYWTGRPLTHDEREYLSLAGSVAAGRGFAYDASFEVGTGPVGPNVWGHAVISIDRYTLGPVPEPQTYLMMIAGIGMVGAMAIRRRNRR